MAALIAYYSRAGENYFGGAYRYIDIGNTETAAKILAAETGAELFPIEQETPYSDVYQECTQQAQDDQRQNARPALKAFPASLDAYDTIYLGYPNYWGTMPMAVFTFLEHFDFTGKTIRPFCTHEGSGIGRSAADICRLCPGAVVEDGLAIRGSDVGRSQAAIANWA